MVGSGRRLGHRQLARFPSSPGAAHRRRSARTTSGSNVRVPRAALSAGSNGRCASVATSSGPPTFTEEVGPRRKAAARGGGRSPRHRVPLHRLFALALCEGPITGIRPHLGRRQPPRPARRDAQVVFGRRGAERRPVDRGDDAGAAAERRLLAGRPVSCSKDLPLERTSANRLPQLSVESVQATADSRHPPKG